ncbi:MAG TPA: universal stress protein, partial [Chthoniobacterales bacterium]
LETAPPPILEEDLAAQRTHLDRLAAGLENVSTIASIGLATDEIVSQATQHGASLIVLGSHGHGALYHLFAGSVVTGVLKRAHMPVLVVPIAPRAKD